MRKNATTAKTPPMTLKSKNHARGAPVKRINQKPSRNNLIIRFEKNTALIAMTAETHHGKKVCSKKYNARKNA